MVITVELAAICALRLRVRSLYRACTVGVVNVQYMFIEHNHTCAMTNECYKCTIVALNDVMYNYTIMLITCMCIYMKGMQ